MLKDEINAHTELCKQLQQYEVIVPHDRLRLKPKQSYWHRFIMYLASPSNNPLERMLSSYVRVNMMIILPLIVVILLSLLQVLLTA